MRAITYLCFCCGAVSLHVHSSPRSCGAVSLHVHSSPRSALVVSPRRSPQPVLQLWSDGRVGRRSRIEDGDDRRLSQGGSGGRFGKIGGGGRKGDARRVGVGGTEKFGNTKSAQIRQAKLEAYVYSEEDPTDGTIGRVIAGSLLITIFALLAFVFSYYGGVDGLMDANNGHR